ncbi:hypothetical protein [Micromonospora sp. WMMD975]|uniref:hypothetical protein n=1 Tax=Micromonospora sp. WMMD975 TaxID=3016087 RepID=UPI00249AFE11|nr:hypothetical protein [Micromonospora sp. WMMD975]WFE31404.1 hypothetical protein O7613_17435 [Micromonospora sp. WMMD975]
MLRRVNTRSDPALHEVGSRARTQPPPPAIVFDALTDPDRDPARPWLVLLDDEQRPRVLEAAYPELVVWSSLWPRRPDARVRFELASDGRAGSLVRWRLLVAEPLPDGSLLGHLRKRLNRLINAELRYTFGQ